MKTRLNVTIVVARCIKTKEGFGIRFEEKSLGEWVADWAFPLKDNEAKREGYTYGQVKGTFGFDSSYPGCPYCKHPTFFQCGGSCRKIVCWDGISRTNTCPWCNVTATMGDGHITQMTRQGDSYS